MPCPPNKLPRTTGPWPGKSRVRAWLGTAVAVSAAAASATTVKVFIEFMALSPVAGSAGSLLHALVVAAGEKCCVGRHDPRDCRRERGALARRRAGSIARRGGMVRFTPLVTLRAES